MYSSNILLSSDFQKKCPICFNGLEQETPLLAHLTQDKIKHAAICDKCAKSFFSNSNNFCPLCKDTLGDLFIYHITCEASTGKLYANKANEKFSDVYNINTSEDFSPIQVVIIKAFFFLSFFVLIFITPIVFSSVSRFVPITSPGRVS